MCFDTEIPQLHSLILTGDERNNYMKWKIPALYLTLQFPLKVAKNLNTL